MAKDKDGVSILSVISLFKPIDSETLKEMKKLQEEHIKKIGKKDYGTNMELDKYKVIKGK